MPIYESAGSIVVHFGAGDVLMSPGFHPERNRTDELMFQEFEARPVGSVMSKEEAEALHGGKNSEELGIPVRFAFANVESVDALMQSLKELRAVIENETAKGAPLTDEQKDLVISALQQEETKTP